MLERIYVKSQSALKTRRFLEEDIKVTGRNWEASSDIDDSVNNGEYDRFDQGQ